MSSNEEILDMFGAKPIEIDLTEEEVRGRLVAESVVDDEGNEIVPRNGRLTKDNLEILWSKGRTKLHVWDVDPAIAATLERDNTTGSDDAVLEMFRRLRPNEPARVENAREYVYSLFFDTRRYNLGRVGRYKMNRRLGIPVPENITEHNRLLTLEDICKIIQGVIDLRNPESEGDDIDHLGNRRVRSVGELLQNQIRIGLLRMERIAKERMTTIPDLEAAGEDLVTSVPSLRLFASFWFGQLSQFMDQTNPRGSNAPPAPLLWALRSHVNVRVLKPVTSIIPTMAVFVLLKPEGQISGWSRLCHLFKGK